MSTVSWDIDAEDRLCAFGGTWPVTDFGPDPDRFAPSRLLGRPLLSLFSDAALRDAWAGLLRTARLRPRRIRLTYRCDTAAERRLYLLRLTARIDAGIHFTTRLLQTRARPPQPGWNRSESGSFATWDFCSQCNQVALPAVGWFELEEISPLALFSAPGTPRFRPALCPRCLGSIRAAMAA